MTFCTECGASISDNSKFCSSCGSALNQTEVAAIKSHIANQHQSSSGSNGTQIGWGILAIGCLILTVWLKFYSDQLPDCNDSQVEKLVTKVIVGEEMSNKPMAFKYKNTAQKMYDANAGKRFCKATLVVAASEAEARDEKKGFPIEYSIVWIDKASGTFRVTADLSNE